MDCSKLTRVLPEARPQWTVRRGAEELRDVAMPTAGMRPETFAGPRFVRIMRMQELQEAGGVDDDLRRRLPVVSG